MVGNANKREEDLGFIPVAGNSGTIKYPVEPIPCWTLFTEGVLHPVKVGSFFSIPSLLSLAAILVYSVKKIIYYSCK